jgi:hypothetical protein
LAYKQRAELKNMAEAFKYAQKKRIGT